MNRPISLAALTVLELSPPSMVSCAAETGYDRVGIRLIPSTAEEPHHDTLGITPLVREIRARSEDLGIPVHDVETVRLTESTVVGDLERFLETGAFLGATDIVVAGLDHDRGRLTANLAALSVLAADYGLTPDLEFMPWTAVPNVTTAIAVITDADHPNLGILVDSIHFDRSDSDPQQLDGLPESWLRYMQICDAPRERPVDEAGLIHAARHDRLMPGDGHIDLSAQVSRLPGGAPISVEVPLADELPALERARCALEHTRSVLDSVSR